MPEFDYDAALSEPAPVGPSKVDLKWSLWSADEGNWEHYAKEAWDALQNLGVGQSVTIDTAPSKETRYGSVDITHVSDNPSRWTAEGRFSECWDEAGDLLDALGLPEAAYDDFAEILPFASDGAVGVYEDFEVYGASLPDLMQKIDEEEISVITSGTVSYEYVSQWARDWLAAHRPKRKKKAR